MKGDGRTTTIWRSKLLMRSALPYLYETQRDKDGDNFVGLQDRNISHQSSDSNLMNANKLRFKDWFAILQEHGDNFLEI
jgi:hypothetical protein